MSAAVSKPSLIPVNDLKRHNDTVAGQITAAVQRVLARGWYILGPEVEAFEAEFADFCGTRHCISSANGTDAMELSLRALEIGPGDEVITAANAGGYATAAIRAIGARPRYCEVDPDSMLLSPEAVAASLTPCTRAVIATHLYGLTADMPRLEAVCLKAGIPLIEDCAQAHGAILDGRRAGAWGNLACFSFYPTKNLGAVGDGGAVTTNDSQLAERLRILRQYGWTRKYHATRPGGRNSRLDEIQAAVLRVKLQHLEKWNDARRAIATFYTEAFQGIALTCPAIAGPEYVAHLYVVRSTKRDALRENLKAAGIATDVHYPVPDHLQETARGEPWASVHLPVTEECCRQAFTLPCFPEMSRSEMERVAGAVHRAVCHSEGNGG